MKISEITFGSVGRGLVNRIGKEVGMSRDFEFRRKDTKPELPSRPEPEPATATAPAKPAAAGTTIPALAPDQVAFLDFNGSKVFLSKDGKNWMQYQGSMWPHDIATSQVISDPKSLDAIDAAMAAGKLQIASTKKTANFSKPGFTGYQTK